MSDQLNIYQKLNEARIRLKAMDLKKSGHNKYSDYRYYELGDFLPHALDIFAELGLCGAVTFSRETGRLTITDCDKPENTIIVECPFGEATLKACHDVQNIGAVQTYTRRYLWIAAMELVEHDAVDASSGPANTAPPRAQRTTPEQPKPDNDGKRQDQLAKEAFTQWTGIDKAVDIRSGIRECVKLAGIELEKGKQGLSLHQWEQVKLWIQAQVQAGKSFFDLVKEASSSTPA